MKSGAITNSGEIASGGNFRIDGGTLDLSSGSKIGSGATEVTISIVPFVNPVSAEIGTQATNITLQNNEFSNSGSIAYGATYLTINNGSFTNTNSLAENLVSDLTISFSEGVNSGIMGSSTSLAFESSTLINSGTVLTNYLSLVNSTITNDGFMQTGGGVLTSNAIEGSGIFQISDGIYSSVPITQGTVYIGTLTQPGSLETQQNVNANVQIIGSESFLLSQNDININNLYSEGKVNPGIAVYNTLTLAGSGTLTETSTYLVDISSNNGPSDRIIANGDFAIQPGAVLNINFPESTFPLPALYTIIQTQNGSITGSFSQINFPDIGGTFQIIYNPTSVQIFTDLDGPGVKNWTGAAKDQFWLDGSNWLDGAIPSIVDTVIFNPQYQSVGNVSLGTGVYSGTPSAAVLEFTPDPGNNFGAYTFIDGQLN